MDWKSKKWMIVPFLIILVATVAPWMILHLSGDSGKNKIAPEIEGISDWVNSSPLLLSKLKGKVIIVDFWTYSCINCIRTIPHLNDWYDKYKDYGLVIIGVHSPEFIFEKELDRVRSAVTVLKIKYPVALDSEHKTWDAFANQYWPHKYFIGADGNLRYDVIGEGQYEESEQKITELLSETGVVLPLNLRPVEEEKVEFQKIKTPEIFFGSFRDSFLGNPLGLLSGKERPFKIPDHLEKNTFYLSGRWDIKEQYAIHNDSTVGEIRIYFEAKSVNWVAGSSGKGGWVEIKIDGNYLNSSQTGSDVVIDKEGRSKIFISENRLYRIIHNRSGYGKHLLTLQVSTPEIESYTLTFG